MCGCFDNCVGVLVICVLVFTVFCIVLFCDYFIWCVSCTVVGLTCFVMCVCVCVCGGGFVMYGCVYMWVF
jgi:hypothetical protein